MDLLPFQAGSYASDVEETEYDIDANLVRRVQLEAPEEYYDVTETTDEKPV